MRHESGFSFIELILHMLLMGLIMAGIAGLLQGGQETVIEQQGSIGTRQAGRVAVAAITRDLQLAGYHLAGFPEAILRAEPSRLILVGDVDRGDPALPCTTEPAIERVNYVIEEGNLWRSVDCWTGVIFTEVGGTPRTLLASGLTAASAFTYFDANGLQLRPGGVLSPSERAAVRTAAINLTQMNPSPVAAGSRVPEAATTAARVALRNR